MRRDRKQSVKSDSSDKEVTHSVAKSTRKAPGPYIIPDVPVGEDDERHNRVLQSEWSKSSRNAVVVDQLMECTFAMRRRDHNTSDVFTKYPFLQETNQVRLLHVHVHVNL